MPILTMILGVKNLKKRSRKKIEIGTTEAKTMAMTGRAKVMETVTEKAEISYLR